MRKRMASSCRVRLKNQIERLPVTRFVILLIWISWRIIMENKINGVFVPL